MAPAATAPSSSQARPWPSVGKYNKDDTKAHAQQLLEDCNSLHGAITDRRTMSSGPPAVPGGRVLPLLQSVKAFAESFLRTGTGAPVDWAAQLTAIRDEISQAQQQQTKQLEEQIAEINKTITAATNQVTLQGSSGSSGTTQYNRVRTWAKVAAGEAEPPQATKTIQSWTSATGSTYQEYVTGPQEREIIIKLHNSTVASEDNSSSDVRSWIQGKMANNPRALVDHINDAIQRAALQGSSNNHDTPMADGPRDPEPQSSVKPYRGVQIHSAIFLKSGDIQAHTAFVSQAKLLLAHAEEWVKFVGNNAKAVVPTYGVIIHSIPTVSFDHTRQRAMATQLKTLNAGVLQNAKITYMGWLTREGADKVISSIVVEFTAPEPANRLIHAGCLWSNETHIVEKYDRACRIKQCLRCQKYGHITTQCAAAHNTCGYCSGSHDSRRCTARSATPRGTPKCALCKQQHPTWSAKCDIRKKEKQRVEEALKNRTTYWPETKVPTPVPTLVETATTAMAAATLSQTIGLTTPTQPATLPTLEEFSRRAPTVPAPTAPALTLTRDVSFDFTNTQRVPRRTLPGRRRKTGSQHSQATRARPTEGVIDNELAMVAPQISLADDGPNKKRKRDTIPGVTRSTLQGSTPGKPTAPPGTVRPQPRRRSTVDNRRSFHRSSSSESAIVVQGSSDSESSDGVPLAAATTMQTQETPSGSVYSDEQ